jgi:hypothetical protein
MSHATDEIKMADHVPRSLILRLEIMVPLFSTPAKKYAWTRPSGNMLDGKAKGKSKRLEQLLSRKLAAPLGRRPASWISRLRFSQFKFSIEITAKGGHHVAYPPHEVRCFYSFERSSGKVGGSEMKGTIPTTAESIYIGRAEKPLDTLIVQMQTSKAFHHNVKASIPIVHEITARTGEQLEY